MQTIKIKKLLEGAQIPVLGTTGSGCFDIFAAEEPIKNEGFLIYRTGLAIELPSGYDLIVLPRSSIYKTNLFLANGVGYIDNDYRGEIKVIFRELSFNGSPYAKGDRIGQIRLLPQIKARFKTVNEVSRTSRGEGGFGSTGLNMIEIKGLNNDD